MKRFWMLTDAVLILIFPSICQTLQISLPDTSYQCDMIMGKVEPPTTVYVNGKPCAVSARGYFVIGVPRSKKKDILVWSKTGRQKASKIVRVLAYLWQIQRIDGLPNAYVNPSRENVKRIRNDNQKVRSIRLAMALAGFKKSDERIWTKKLFVFSILTIAVLSVMMATDVTVSATSHMLLTFAQ